VAVHCSIGFAAGLIMLVAFHLGKNLSDYVSMRDIYKIAQVSLATIAATSLALFR
jgi:energy-converting hydrogenase Eha subunit G